MRITSGRIHHTRRNLNARTFAPSAQFHRSRRGLHLSEWQKAILIAAALVLINFWPVFTGRIPLPTDLMLWFPLFQHTQPAATLNHHHAELGDLVTQFYPWHQFTARSIREQVFPLWNPYLLAGTPFQANPLSALFYPMNWLFVVLPMPVGWSLLLMLKVILAAVFTFLFLHNRGATFFGAIAGGLVFAFGGFMAAWIGWPQTDTALWLPLILLCVHRLYAHPNVTNMLLLAGVLMMPMLAGHPGIAAHVIGASVGYALWCSLWPPARTSLRFAGLFITGAALAVGLAAVQVVPSAEWLSLISRSLNWAWEPLRSWSLLSLFSRDLSQTPNSAGLLVPTEVAYFGALPLLTLVLAPFHRNVKDVTFFMFLLAATIAYAYGLGPVGYLSQTAPIFKGLKKDETLILASFSIAVISAFGISYLEMLAPFGTIRASRFTQSILVVAIASLCHLGIAIVSKITSPGVEWWRSPRSMRVLLVLSAILILLRLARLVTGYQWAVVSLVLVSVDLVSFTYGYIPFNSPDTVSPPTGAYEFLSRQPPPFRVSGLNGTTPVNLEQLYGIPTASGYDFMLARYRSLLEGMIEPRVDTVSFRADQIVRTHHRILDLLNVKYLITSPYNGSESSIATAPDRFRRVWGDGAVTIYENRNVLARAFLVPEKGIETISSDEAQLARVGGDIFDSENVVVLTESPPKVRSNKPSNARTIQENGVSNYAEGINHVHLRVSTTEPSVLVLSQTYYPGWHVTIDGNAAPYLRADYALSATVVDPGIHEVEFRFRPISLVVGAAISMVSALVVVACLIRERRRR